MCYSSQTLCVPEIPDGDVPGQFDHLVFVVHGIGAACDMKFQSVVGATTTMRQMVNEMSERHFSYAHMAGKASRIEFLPVNWHATLHGEDTGTDQRMRALTLRSIPKLRGFVNDTILDVLFYTRYDHHHLFFSCRLDNPRRGILGLFKVHFEDMLQI